MTRRGEKMQEEVLAILRRRGVPMSAYDVLAEMRENNPKIAPPTIYRALSALTARGRVHRLESMNAFVACQCDGNHDGAHHASVLSICDDCGVVEESVAPKLLDDISAISGKSGFQPARHVIEVHGRCASCGTVGGRP